VISSIGGVLIWFCNLYFSENSSGSSGIGGVMAIPELYPWKLKQVYSIGKRSKITSSIDSCVACMDPHSHAVLCGPFSS